ncbi:hypothetical protein QJS64_20895 (plasmid) [Paraclostridium bifermentans]|uniref:Uncharacterized protein n=1 Tax=Paraclostridium bifermentans TaxID=1490 RepID=A0ABY8R9U5_PARBF|nr:hypothetical protein QJS64_20895 [Paraclostridium bifermentans]
MSKKLFSGEEIEFLTKDEVFSRYTTFSLNKFCFLSYFIYFINIKNSF